MRSAFVAAAIGLVAGASASDLPYGQLYGVATYGQFQVQGLYSVDPVTGAATLIGSTGISQINGIAWDASTRQLIAQTTDADLYALNLFTGAATRLADRPAIFPEGDLAIDASGAAFTVTPNVLGRLNLFSGMFSEIGAMGALANDVSGLTFGADGVLYGYAKNGTDEDTILSFNLVTGAASLVGLTGLSSTAAVGGLAFEPVSGITFLTDGASLYTVELATGAATLRGSLGVAGFSGLAIPAPGAGVLVAGAALLAARRRR